MKITARAILSLFLLTFSFASYAQDTGRTASATWQVQRYDLDVTPPTDNSRVVSVKAILSIKNVSANPATTLTLRISPSAEIASVKINDATADFTKNEEKVNASVNLQRILMRFASIPAGASITAAVDYKINVKENSAVAAVSANGSQFLPLSFWYPTPNSWFFSGGPDFASMRMRVNAPNGQTVISSGTEATGIFDQKLNSQPFFLSGNWEISNQPGVAVYIPKGVGADGQKRGTELAALVNDAKTYVAGILGKAPDVNLRLVASRRGAGFGSGGTIIIDEAIFRRSKIDSLTAMNIAEAVAKLWLGNSLSVTGEGYGIVSEGLSRYVATQFIENKFGKDVADIERLRQRTSYSAVSKRDAPLSKVLALDDYYYPVVANKGAMTWRILAKRVGTAEFASIIRANTQDGNLNIRELRDAFSAHKELVDYFFDQVTDTNLLVGLPQLTGADTKVALRNSGSADVTVDVAATTITGEKIVVQTTIKANSYGDISFKSTSKIARVEVDADKLYPQIDYTDDIKPQESTDSDPLLAVKRLFDKKDFVKAESTAKTLLRDLPRFDDLRILLGRSLLAQNKNSEAEKEFRAVLDEKLPTARSLAWANVGLGEIASRSNQTDAAVKFANAAIQTDAEFGASLAARNLRNKLGYASPADQSVKSFFTDFDKAASSNRKAELDALTMPGEVTRFASGVSGSTEQWQTQIRQIDVLDANTVLVEAEMAVKLLNKNAESGLAVYRLIRSGSGWKLATVEMFEVR